VWKGRETEMKNLSGFNYVPSMKHPIQMFETNNAKKNYREVGR
jgi:hypothetical protein